MADDIDIEEHDVLENPRIKNIFPDLMRIKTEAPDPDDEDHHMDVDYSDEAETSHTGTSLQVEYQVHNNHIILGSKRVAHPMHNQGTTSYSSDHFDEAYFDNHSEQQPFEFDENIEIKQEPEDSNYEEIERHGSCIILGSKPSRPVPEARKEQNHDVYSSVVALEDWGPRLQRSNCYCEDCAILFPTRNCLDAHNMAAHSFLVALSKDSLEKPPEAAKLSTNKAVKSTTKNVQFSTKSSLSAPSTSKAKFCNHCNKTFPSDTALITHLYETLTATKFPCKLCDRIFNKEPELIAHIESRHNEADNDDKSFDDGTNERLIFTCHICSCCFKSLKRLEMHMRSNHSLDTYPREKTRFTGTCKLCGSNLGTPKSYNTHVFKVHSHEYLQKPGLKSNVPHKSQALNTSKLSKHPAPNSFFKCSKCGKMFDSYGKARYHKRIHANLPNVLILRVTNQRTQPISTSTTPQTSSNNLFKCKLCGKSFDSHGKYRYHRIKMHPTIPHVSIPSANPTPILKKILKMSKPEKDQSKSNTFIYKGVVDPPVAKSVIFKCSKCPLHFTNCSDAVFHSYNCNKLGDDWKCPVCSRNFAFGHKAVHERQHKVSDRFTVHLTNDNVYGRTLCQCPKCDIYYSEQEFWVHVKQGCGQPKSVPCNECNILIHVSSTKMHKQLHKCEAFTANQLILIEFVSLQDKDADDDEYPSVGSKRKISKGNDASDSKKAKVSTESETVNVKTPKKKRIMHYCNTCKLFSKSTRARDFHLTGKCKSLKHGSNVCKKCGLTTSYGSVDTHEQWHARGYTIFDFTYVRLQDNKIINPMPTFPKCFACGVYFITKTAKFQHDCNVVPKTCAHCKKKFSDAAYKLHVQFHEYAVNRKNDKMRLKKQGSRAIERVTAKEKSLAGKASPMPELLKKYEQLTNTWNILYLCEVCDIVCDSYDKVVEHSQDHFNNMESFDMSIENCKICDLRFDATCFDKHKDLHVENSTLDRQFFNVLQYNYMNLLSENWFEMFSLLPATQMEQIVSQSIYAYNRNVRMRILKDGPPKNTVYKCGRCRGYLTALGVGVHMKSKICSSSPPQVYDALTHHKCTMCKLDFKLVSCLIEHQIACQRTHHTYREVLFNDANDSTFNQSFQHHKANKTKQTGNPKSKGVLYKFYKCDVCGCCSLRGKHAVCVEGVKCPQCDLLIERKKGIIRHRQLHKRYPKLSRNTVTIVHFTPEAYKNLPKLYRCQCGLHFTSLQTIENHLTLCEPGYSISKENCSKCGLLFPTAVLVSHLCSHHSNDKRTEFHVIPMAPNKKTHTPRMRSKNIAATGKTKDPENKSANPRKTVYKCHQCNVCSMTISTLDYHFAQNHKMTIAIEQCDKCGLNFTKSSMKTHVALHHTQLKCSRSDINVKVYKESPFAKFRLQKLAAYTNDNCIKATTSKEKYSRSKEKQIDSDDTDDDILKDNKLALNANVNSTKATTSKEKYSIINEELLERHKDDIFKKDTNDLDRLADAEDRKYLNRYLYQCHDCGMNFLNATSCGTHYSRFHEDIQSSKQINLSCDICGLSFGNKTLSKHKKIHHKIMKLNRADFIVIKCGKLGRNLYKCEECDVHFLTHLSYLSHFSEGEHSIPKATCNICGYDFPEQLLKHHTLNHHTVNQLSPEDLCIITNAYYDETRFRDEEESQDSLLNDGDLEVDDNDESTLAEDETQRQGRRRTTISYKSTTNQESEVTNRLYKCRTCALHFCKEYSLIEHLADASESGHNELGKTCEQCDLKFALEKDLDRHNHEQHEKLKLTLKELLIIESVNEDDKTYATKYLYKCAECDTHFTQEFTAENHQYPRTRTKCEKCGLIFTTADTTDHIKIHHELMDVKIDDYRYIIVASKLCILSERYKALLRNCNADNSIYPCNKGCGLNYISLRAFLEHNSVCTGMVKSNSTKKSRVACEICGLIFSGRTLAVHRRVQHEKLKLKLEDFCFRSFDDLETSSATHSEERRIRYLEKKKKEEEDLGDTSSISHAESIDQEQTSSKGADVSKNKEGADERTTTKYQFNPEYLSSLDLNNYSNQLYRCKVCKKHYFSMKSALAHEHSTLGESCPDCGLIFTSRILAIHHYVHHRKFGLTLSDFFVNSDYSWKKMASLILLYKCGKCDAHFIKFTAALAHTDEQCASNKDRNKICKMCGLTFPPHLLYKHEIEHHRQKKLTANDFTIVNYTGACKNMELSSASTLKQATPNVANISDVDIDESETSTDKADESEIGDMDASETSSVQMDLPVDDFDSNAGKVKVADSSTPEKVIIKLYKCGDCNVYYLSQTTCYKHMMNHQKLDSLEYIECKLCGLQFRILTLRKHMNHHKTNFNLENVLVEEYRTSSGKTPKIDIYYALDKIQSRLVSTTTENKDVSESNVDSTVKDIVISVEDQENTAKEVSNPLVDQNETDTTKILIGPTATKVLATDVDVSNQTLTENVLKHDIDLATDGTISKIKPEVDSNATVEAVSTCTAKDIVDSVQHDVNVKDNDSIVEENLTKSVVDIKEPSLSESVTDYTVKQEQDNNSLAIEDIVRDDLENNQTKTECLEGIKMKTKDIKTLTNQEDESNKVITDKSTESESENVLVK